LLLEDAAAVKVQYRCRYLKVVVCAKQGQRRGVSKAAERWCALLMAVQRYWTRCAVFKYKSIFVELQDSVNSIQRRKIKTKVKLYEKERQALLWKV
jgi:hypothetical protein